MNHAERHSADPLRQPHLPHVGTRESSGIAPPSARRTILWNRLYRTTSYLRSALWTVPFVAIVLVLILVPILRGLDGWLGWRVIGLSVSGAQALCETVITLALSFLVFTFGSLLVAIQVAGGQMTPRIIATTLLRDKVIKYSVGQFVFALVFAVMALNRLDTKVPELVAFITALLGISCVAIFLFLIDHSARLLRPISILARVGDQGLAVITAVYPAPAGADPDTDAAMTPPVGPRRTVLHTGPSEIVLAIDLLTIVAEAQRTRGVVEFLPQVGDFVSTGTPLFVLHGGAVAIADRDLRATVAFGPERTLEQDPLFAFRIMTDIALKALSPAINDPTTAVLALDQLHRLLRAAGRRHLRGETIFDSASVRRVIHRTPNWEDFVAVACTEIRLCGAGSLQISRRLFAMLDELLAVLPAYRHEVLEEERRRLSVAVESFYAIPEDRALARIPDSQGLGAASRTRR